MTNHWNFVAAAYGITALGTALVLFSSWRAMVKAEARVDAMARQRGERVS